jgi:RNA polymerase sigma factor (sigma-70 family)
VTTKPASQPTEQGVRLAVMAADQGAARIKRWFSKRLRRSPQDVEDLAQEVQLRLLRVSDDLLLRQPLAYITRVALSVLIEHSKVQRTRREHVELDSDGLENEAEGPPGDDPAYRLQFRAEMDRALARLSSIHRDVLLLHKRDGYSHQETAKHLGLSEDQVRRYVVEAKAKLRMLLWPIEGKEK